MMALIARQPENPRPRIAGLRQRRHRAGFDEAEAEPQNRIDRLAVLVEPRREAERIGEIKAERFHREPRIIRRRRRYREQPQPANRRRCAVSAR